jgi:hypothetical protein
MTIKYIIGVCLVLVVAGLTPPVLGETEYFALFMEGKKSDHYRKGEHASEPS